MDAVDTYKVICLGGVREGFIETEVHDAFAKLFKIQPEKAAVAISGKRVLKKGLSFDKAQVYKKRLEQIGLHIELTSEAQVASAALTLEPFATSSDAETLAMMTCPKCQLDQPKAEQCVGCGVYVNKVHVKPVPEASPVTPDDAASMDAPEQENIAGSESALNLKAVVAATAVALLGAFAWYFVAVTFDYELGLLAWAIGGLVGGVAVALGGRGNFAAILCGGLVLLAIMGGKFMAVQAWQDKIADEMRAAFQGEEMRVMYDREMELAQRYKNEVVDEASKRAFIVDNGYAVAEDATGLSAADIEFFDTTTAPRLEKMSAGALAFEDWGYESFGKAVEQTSPAAMVRYSFDWLDIVFLFLGIGTAYRLVAGRESK